MQTIGEKKVIIKVIQNLKYNIHKLRYSIKKKMKFRYLFILMFKFDNTVSMLIIQTYSCKKKKVKSQKSDEESEIVLAC